MRRGLLIVILVAAGGTAAADVSTDEQDAYERARPVFEKYCTKCHSPSSPGADSMAIEHLDMGAYPFKGHHAAEAGAEVREALGASGEPATMPDDEPGAVKGAELDVVLAWAAAFDRAHGGGGMDMDMDMHDMDMDHDMAGMHHMSGMSMDMREGSGTAWQPAATPMAMHHEMRGGWMLMLHYSLHAGYDWQATPRGEDRPFALGWFMGMADHALAGGDFGLRVMLSPEAIFLGKRGIPLLLQSGEGLVDHQHAHDLFMEIAARYTRALSDDVSFVVYGAPVGEPAVGPVAFPHRPYALYDMTATLGHHWQDSTHISFGVVSLGVFTKHVKLDASLFNGREPDADRYDFDFGSLDSYAARLTINPSDHWSAEVSYAYLDQPEASEPGVHVRRAVASVTYAGDDLDVTAVLGRNLPTGSAQSSAALIEASGHVCDHVVLFGRAELLEKLGAELQLADADKIFGMGSLGAGAVYEFDLPHHAQLGVGARVTADFVGDLRAAYGTTTPAGAMLYVEAHPKR